MTEQSEIPIEEFIVQAFQENFELLALESGHTISDEVKETALQQVKLYWRKLRHIAERVTDTEVHLTLPNQRTPAGREYAIEGVVDIVREDDRVTMYDIKTHDAEYVRANIELYKQQLNVYAYIWQELRRQPLDEMAVIGTDFPHNIKEALTVMDSVILEEALKSWDPVVPVEFDPAYMERTLYEFGRVVDRIEEGKFEPPPLETLQSTIKGVWMHERFGSRVCRQCDARFSCSSYRQYAMGSRQVAEGRMQYFMDDNPDQELWRTAELERFEE